VRRSSKAFIAFSAAVLSTVLVSPPLSLTLSALLFFAALLYSYRVKRKGRKTKAAEHEQLKIVIELPKPPWSIKNVFRVVLRSELKGRVDARKNLLRGMPRICLSMSIALASIATLFLTGNVVCLFLAPLSIIVLLAPMLHEKVLTTIRKQEVENELPFFSLLASALSHAGHTLVKAFSVAAEAKIFPAISTEALHLRKEALFTGGDNITAMSSYAQRNPSKLLSSLILGYTSLLRSGGDVVKYLEERTKELLALLKDRWSSFVNYVNIIGEAMLGLFLIAPLMLSMTILVFASEVDFAFYELIVFGLIPLLTLLAIYLIHVTRPQEGFEYAPDKRVVLLSLALATTLAFALIDIFKVPPLRASIVSLSSIALPLSVHYEKERRKVLEVERELPRFLRYLGEHKRLGFPLLTAIEKSSNERYNKQFSSLIKGVLAKTKLGLSLYQSTLALRLRSKLCKAVFFTLDHLIATGGGSLATFELMASYIDEYNAHRSRIKRSLYLYSVLGYATPMILAICLSLTLSIVKGVGELPSASAVGGSLALISTISLKGLDRALSYSELMIVASSISTGLVLGKAIDGTLFSTKHLLICITVALISLNLFL